MTKDSNDRSLDALVTSRGDDFALRGARCGTCDALFYPLRKACERCGSTTMHEEPLPRTGTLWSWTSQNFPPPAPPYFRGEDKATYAPYWVGYVDLGEVLVLSRVRGEGGLTVGDPMKLELEPLPGADGSVPALIPVFVRFSPSSPSAASVRAVR
ncbi:MAG: OB-fold domain-containing protein [Sinimarinibacterium sp.]|jgi:uncharacterized OB-fold protein